MTVRAMRADILYRALLEQPERVEYVEDIAKLSRVAMWLGSVREAAIADLVADGRITEAADGRLCIHLRSAA